MLTMVARSTASLVVVISGMQPEYDIAKDVSDSSAFYGTARYNMGNFVPFNCTGLVSFGVAGGLDPRNKRGFVILPTKVVTAKGTFTVDPHWLTLICSAMLGSDVVTVTSTQAFSDPNVWVTDPTDRAKMFASSGCAISDNESWAVAEFAASKNLPFVVIRAISDESDDTVINDPDEITADGKPNIFVDIKDFIRNPLEVIHEGIGFAQALNALKKTTKRLGAGFACPYRGAFNVSHLSHGRG